MTSKTIAPAQLPLVPLLTLAPTLTSARLAVQYAPFPYPDSDPGLGACCLVHRSGRSLLQSRSFPSEHVTGSGHQAAEVLSSHSFRTGKKKFQCLDEVVWRHYNQVHTENVSVFETNIRKDKPCLCRTIGLHICQIARGRRVQTWYVGDEAASMGSGSIHLHGAHRIGVLLISWEVAKYQTCSLVLKGARLLVHIAPHFGL